MGKKAALCVCMVVSTSILHPLFAIGFWPFHRHSRRKPSSLISMMCLTLTALALRPLSKGSKRHGRSRRRCACVGCKVVFFIYFRLRACPLYSKRAAVEVLHPSRRCPNDKCSRQRWKKEPQRTRLCREPEHSVLVYAARHEECVALCRQPLSLAGNGAANASD